MRALFTVAMLRAGAFTDDEARKRHRGYAIRVVNIIFYAAYASERVICGLSAERAVMRLLHIRHAAAYYVADMLAVLLFCPAELRFSCLRHAAVIFFLCFA